jgi:Ala-tRNA(Pro) deacylase
MGISGKLASFLQSAHVAYTSVKHPVAYTAQEIAAAQHVPGRQLAKSVLVNTPAGSVLAVLPAIERVDLKQLKALLRAKTLAIAKEADIKQRFPDIEVGAMSPFGNLYQVPVVVDQALADAGEIVFNGGTHTDTVKMKYADFARLVSPRVGRFGETVNPPAPKKKSKKVKKVKTKTAKKNKPAKKKPAAKNKRR